MNRIIRILQDMLQTSNVSWLFFPVSPSFLIITAIKYFSNRSLHRGVQIIWSSSFLAYSTVLVVVSCIQNLQPSSFRSYYGVAIAVIAFSRAAEIIHGFYRDAVDRFIGKPSATGLKAVTRIHWLALSYLENVVNFAALYLVLEAFLPGRCFSRNIHSMGDAVYFSTITITTTGFGDIAPINGLTKSLAMFECLSGTFLIVAVLAIYVSSSATPASEPKNVG